MKDTLRNCKRKLVCKKKYNIALSNLDSGKKTRLSETSFKDRTYLIDFNKMYPLRWKRVVR